jgi:hypothetical protein
MSTGDEPLSVAQTISGVQAVIVTTPQEISLADVRKAINFCRKVAMPILGLVENLSGLVCPHCGGEIRLFSQGGGQKTAALMKVPLLASLPFDLRVVESGDLGKPSWRVRTIAPSSGSLGGSWTRWRSALGLPKRRWQNNLYKSCHQRKRGLNLTPLKQPYHWPREGCAITSAIANNSR